MAEKHPPLVLLTFANERQENTRYLRALPEESRAIQAALRPAERLGLCRVKVLANLTPAELFDTLQDADYRDRIAVLHYGGHADSFELLLEAGDRANTRAHASGLIPLLAGQKGLQLVFLNGCSTEKTARQLNNAGIPLVVGTFESIRDEVARLLAEQFYTGLGQGMPLERAWQEATARIRTDTGDDLRSIGQPKARLDRFPWQLFQKAGAAIDLNWNLPDAASNPLAMLPFAAEKYPLPEQPFRFLGRYRQEDAGIYFGRAHYIRDMYDRLTNPLGAPVICLSGQSGVGKSSFLEAGLLPRIEDRYFCLYLRRDPEKGLAGTLQQALAKALDGTAVPDTIAECWQALEKQCGKALVVILDQAEEAFTRPLAAGNDELEALAVAMRSLWVNAGARPAGKLLLSFRKEYEPELDDLLRANRIPAESVFLKTLSQPEIIEIVTGLERSGRLRQKYGLTVEAGLPELIAADLLSDSDTAVAPVLQIVLTKLWQQIPERADRVFKTEDYLKLKEDGIFLGDFFRQQMEHIKHWEQQLQNNAESSGLALDLLHAHVTEMGYSNSCALEALRQTYRHRADVLEQLLVLFKELYLLTDLGKDRNALAHDTLAPVILQAFKNSSHRGQKALRILSSKVPNYRRNPGQTYLDNEDLRLVEQGADGMRLWVAEEADLIEKSRKRRQKRRRETYLLLGGMAVLLVAAAWLGFGFYQKSRLEKWIAQARLEAGIDPTTGLRTLRKALADSPDNPAVLNAYFDIFSNNEFYDTILHFPLPVKGLALAPGGAGIVYTWTDKAVYRFDRRAARLDSFLLENLAAAALSPDGQWLVAGTWNGDLLCLEAARLRQDQRALLDAPASLLAFMPDGKTLFAGSTNAIVTIDLQDIRRVHNRLPLSNELTALQYHPGRETLLLGYKEGTIEERDPASGATLLSIRRHKDQVLAFAVMPGNKDFVSTGRDAVLHFWGGQDQLNFSIKAHDRRINALVWSPDGQRLLTVSTDQLFKSWSAGGDWISTYRGHTGSVNALAVSTDGRSLVSGSDDKSLRFWRVESKVNRHFGPHPNGVTGALFGTGGQAVFTASDTGIRDVGEYMNDPGYDLSQAVLADACLYPREAYIWETNSGKKQKNLEGHACSINAVAQTSDGNLFATASHDQTIILWDRNGRKMQQLRDGHRHHVLDVAFSPDGKHLLSGGFDSTAVLWDASGKKLRVLRHPAVVSAVAFHPGNKLFATGAYDGIVRLFDLNGKQVDSLFRPGQNRIMALCFAPDGRYLLTGEWNNFAHLYPIGNKQKQVVKIEAFSKNKTGLGIIHAVDFSSDGKEFALGAEGGLALVYRLVKDRPVPVCELQHFPPRTILSVSFAADGQSLLTGSNDGWARIWALNR
ncbi:MAG: CHAT domain-containing protein [Lewinellaceae bacterium]|nr:CHAT domain-containing protein [Lewinellaceae bacterium]